MYVWLCQIGRLLDFWGVGINPFGILSFVSQQHLFFPFLRLPNFRYLSFYYSNRKLIKSSLSGSSVDGELWRAEFRSESPLFPWGKKGNGVSMITCVQCLIRTIPISPVAQRLVSIFCLLLLLSSLSSSSSSSLSVGKQKPKTWTLTTFFCKVVRTLAVWFQTLNCNHQFARGWWLVS